MTARSSLLAFSHPRSVHLLMQHRGWSSLHKTATEADHLESLDELMQVVCERGLVLQIHMP